MEMENVRAQLGELNDSQLLAVIDSALDNLTDDRLRLPSDRERLELLRRTTRLQARVSTWQQQVAADAEQAMAAWHEHGTSTLTFLGESLCLTPKESGRLIRAGQNLEYFPIVAASAARGELLPSQTEAITSVITHLPAVLSREAVDRAQSLLVGFAGSHNATELRRLSEHLLEVLAPDVADDIEADRLEREYQRANQNRNFNCHYDGHGSMYFRGSLPVADAEPFVRILDSYGAAARRGEDRLDPMAEYLTPAMRRADALIAMVHHHQQLALAPGNGGDRPRVVVTVRYERLLAEARRAGAFTTSGQLTTGEAVAPSVLRRWLCDADILPVVLGGDSQILDVGRAQRLATPAVRVALEQRDGGCVFPGCDKPPHACHAHHILPWWAGGATALGNLVLVCPHHHGIVEPGRDPTAERWQVRIRSDGLPEVLPPVHVDPRRRPRLHARFWHRCSRAA